MPLDKNKFSVSPSFEKNSTQDAIQVNQVGGKLRVGICHIEGAADTVSDAKPLGEGRCKGVTIHNPLYSLPLRNGDVNTAVVYYGSSEAQYSLLNPLEYSRTIPVNDLSEVWVRVYFQVAGVGVNTVLSIPFEIDY